MKQETKKKIVAVGTSVLTVGTACMTEILVGGGAVAVINHLLSESMTKGQMRMYQAIVFTGSIGVAALAANEMYPKFAGIMEDILDLIPTDKEEKDG